MRRAEAGEEVSRAEVKRIIQEAKANLNPKERRRSSLWAAGTPQACSADAGSGR